MLINRIRRLKAQGVLGINRRNAWYTRWHNQRRYYPLVDDKLKTKEIALRAGLSVPPLYHVISSEHQIRHLEEKLARFADFAVKPSRGAGGKGIVVVTGRSHHLYRLTDDALIDQSELNYHVANVLSGMYSLGGHRDRVIFEYRVRFDPVFKAISYQGVPDIRIIVFRGVPVMAMVRLPTRMSGGKANLHQGAVGAGVDLSTGRTLGGVWRDLSIADHPDTGESIQGVLIPGWRSLLHLAAGCYELTRLGYIGVDLVLDKDKGPLILEVNARPGLNIQIANSAGLLPRLNAVETRTTPFKNIDERIAFAMEHFSVKNEAPAQSGTFAIGNI